MLPCQQNFQLESIWRFCLTHFISANNEDIGQKLLPDTYDHILMLYKLMTLKGQRSRSHQGYIGLARCCYIS